MKFCAYDKERECSSDCVALGPTKFKEKEYRCYRGHFALQGKIHTLKEDGEGKVYWSSD